MLTAKDIRDLVESGDLTAIGKEIDLLEDAIPDYEENLGELRAQFGSEVSLYGDAWPGAQIDLLQCERRIHSLHLIYQVLTRTFDRLNHTVPLPPPTVSRPQYPVGDDFPF